MRGRFAAGAWLCALLAAFTVCGPVTETSFAGPGGDLPGNPTRSQTIRQTTIMTAAERDDFTKPPKYYTDAAGQRYRLADWNVVCTPGGEIASEAVKEVVYRAVEGVQVIPWQITVQEEQDGQGEETARGVLEMTEKTVLEETWSDEFSVPVTFHAYGAEQYELGAITIAAGEALPPVEEYRQELLRILGLKDSDYLVEDMQWDGDPYVDESGELCRNALAVGKKRVADYRVVYAGQVSRQLPDTYCLNTVYELNTPAREPSVSIVRETTAEAERPPQENETGKIWYWIRSGVVVTIAAGLFAILLGTLILLAAWRREERGKKGHRDRSSQGKKV